jgi:hypothetical protein
MLSPLPIDGDIASQKFELTAEWDKAGNFFPRRAVENSIIGVMWLQEGRMC